MKQMIKSIPLPPSLAVVVAHSRQHYSRSSSSGGNHAVLLSCPHFSPLPHI